MPAACVTATTAAAIETSVTWSKDNKIKTVLFEDLNSTVTGEVPNHLTQSANISLAKNQANGPISNCKYDFSASLDECHEDSGVKRLNTPRIVGTRHSDGSVSSQFSSFSTSYSGHSPVKVDCVCPRLQELGERHKHPSSEFLPRYAQIQQSHLSLIHI